MNELMVPAKPKKTSSIQLPRVYFAGKITKNDWRDDLPSRSRGEPPSPEDHLQSPAFDPTYEIDNGDFIDIGPFFIACDHGCSHGPNNHGVAVGCADGDVFDRAALVVDVSMKRVARCDLFYAFVNAATAYGTLVEIGYAKALGKRIVLQFTPDVISRLHGQTSYVGVETPEEKDGYFEPVGAFDMWFARQMADEVWVKKEPDPMGAVDWWFKHKEKVSEEKAGEPT